MSEGKMELRELSDGRVLRFDPATGKTWQLTSWGRWELIDEPEADDGDSDEEGEADEIDDSDLPSVRLRTPGGYVRFHQIGRGAQDIDPRYLREVPWRELLGMGTAKETTPGYFQQTQAAIVETLNQALQDGELLGDYPDADKLRLTLDTTEWDASLAKLGESLRRATDKTQVGEGESDEKPEPDYRSDAAWE